ncbi:hypothetical protein F2P44_20550 [Massilia sp. CCM 8695]|uniref:Uncharacterized protein n=1 Tax=Massilia frigida TaxID=2609281 RepID=A0ABX0NHG6_9BURK|nr:MULTISPECIES: DUF5908 family protein [Massilia]MDM5180501.1 DUF5908 family protein [Massilia sp. DJPM01]NHZ81650.1 hypothetical protein [Massilia frigida]
MPIEIAQLNIKSNVVQGASGAGAARAQEAAPVKKDTCVPGGPQLGADDKTVAQRTRLLRDAINQMQER